MVNHRNKLFTHNCIYMGHTLPFAFIRTNFIYIIFTVIQHSNDAAIAETFFDSGDDGAEGEEDDVHLHPDQTVADLP